MEYINCSERIIESVDIWSCWALWQPFWKNGPVKVLCNCAYFPLCLGFRVSHISRTKTIVGNLNCCLTSYIKGQLKTEFKEYLNNLRSSHTHSRTHARTYARMHALTHTHVHTHTNIFTLTKIQPLSLNLHNLMLIPNKCNLTQVMLHLTDQNKITEQWDSALAILIKNTTPVSLYRHNLMLIHN